MQKKKEINHVNSALGACGYPSWSFKRMREQMDQREQENNMNISKMDSKDKSTKIRVILPYVSGVSQALGRVFCCHGVATSMKPNLTLNRMLEHLKDKRTP